MQLNRDELYIHVAVELEKWREQRGLTQQELAWKAGLGRTSISNIENHAQKPPLHVLYAICIALELEPVSILPTVARVTTDPILVNVVIEGKAMRVPRDAARKLLAAAKKLLADAELNRKE
jgi:transcriptional regulator with XRE-family HTH domain